MGANRSAELEESPDEATYCARHPEVETYLRCGRCGTSICPRCLVQTPVGARCRECANISRLPTFNVTPEYFARGMMAAILAGGATGWLWTAFSDGRTPIGLFTILFGLGLGYVVAEAVSRATNRKRGLGLQVCAVLGVALAFLVFINLARFDFSFSVPLRFQGDAIAAIVAAAFAASRLKGF